MAVTPVLTGPLPTTSLPSPEISVVTPTSTPGTSVMALFGPATPSNGTPRSRARSLFPWAVGWAVSGDASPRQKKSVAADNAFMTDPLGSRTQLILQPRQAKAPGFVPSVCQPGRRKPPAGAIFGFLFHNAAKTVDPLQDTAGAIRGNRP